jgi:hypothetical protein
VSQRHRLALRASEKPLPLKYVFGSDGVVAAGIMAGGEAVGSAGITVTLTYMAAVSAVLTVVR